MDFSRQQRSKLLIYSMKRYIFTLIKYVEFCPNRSLLICNTYISFDVTTSNMLASQTSRLRYYSTCAGFDITARVQASIL